MKSCKVPVDRAIELCPDPRIFQSCVVNLADCQSREEIIRVIEESNLWCETIGCPYLKEDSDVRE